MPKTHEPDPLAYRRRKRGYVDEAHDFHELDKFHLEDECILQPKLRRHYAEKLAAARLRYGQAQAEVAVVAAEQSLAIRKNPNAYNLDKITEDVVKNAVFLTLEWQEAQRYLLKAKELLDLYQAACDTLDDRRRSLELLWDMHKQSYYAEPRLPQHDREELQDRRRQQLTRPNHRMQEDDG